MQPQLDARTPLFRVQEKSVIMFCQRRWQDLVLKDVSGCGEEDKEDESGNR